MLHHDNARTHCAIRVCQFLTQRMVTVEHPSYSPDLTPVNLFLFPRLNAPMKSESFADVNAIKDCVTAVVRSIPQESFADSFQKPYGRSQKCILADSD